MSDQFGSLPTARRTTILPSSKLWIPDFRTAKTIMADFNKFDPRVDSLVIETKTFWDAAIGKLADADMHWLADAVHRHPEKASNVQYERAHTGFTRTITVTVADIERLYDEKMSG